RKILFLCVHNSARSQMAAALMNKHCGAVFEAKSAGLEPGTLNLLAVEVLREIGIDISQNETQRVFAVWKSGELFQYVITVCSEAEAQGCPIFPGPATRLHWPFDDPSKLTGTQEEKMAGTRAILKKIDDAVQEFCAKECLAAE
ncbi:MAG: arsenate reductase ArsC, partial [Verrucomicrobiota bacterium]